MRKKLLIETGGVPNIEAKFVNPPESVIKDLVRGCIVTCNGLVNIDLEKALTQVSVVSEGTDLSIADHQKRSDGR